MSSAELCNFCKCEYSFSRELYNNEQITCSSCGMKCGYFFMNDKTKEPPDLVNQRNSIPPDKLEVSPVDNYEKKGDSPNASSADDSKSDSNYYETSTNINSGISETKTGVSEGYRMYINIPTFSKGLKKLDEFAKQLNLDYSVIENSKENLKTYY